uniref:Uncharacterized protein n=1 Tax=Pyrodinium bahamense TaxID=73915 RepID=A0A7S0FPF8_9DINO|mmetsp:Transcript_41051/g.114095  ORF Transcript_41051/g.114095 Transcript_41051/m.114095 type:complete len:278 (+) Transcript_41051:66-899(+)|eukprot:CAMPEP_0179069110 /NCGR_PEP_ID=MMETSP0796-20121207/30341_1 /TAXON_ID=73915 /ORGANISM="Pyrodinium bahamense, Strain pbaha01" /LENGTH=277 /DNA_ID=CAMNT_0020766171 /DNA_START=66 /DNA_END=899 /DNA_ORIENTATION=-
MPPVKFDDLPKVASEVLNDDYQTAGYQLKAKQKTSFAGAVATTAVDLWGKDAVQTPAKITWKLPKPLGIAGVSVDKLEMDKAGKFKLEASVDKAAHSIADLKVEAKSDMVDMKKATLGCTFTGIKDTQLKLETTPFNLNDFSLEATKAVDKVTMGFKCGKANLTMPDVGLRIESGPLFCALLAKEKFSAFSVSACYKANADLKLACTYAKGGKSGGFGAGLAYVVKPGTLLKAKFQQDGSVSAALKHDLAKGFTILTGAKYGTQDGKQSFGLQLSIE